MRNLNPKEFVLVTERAVEIFGKESKELTCTCHWPATGAPCHAQDCDVEQAWDRAFDLAVDELYEEGRIQ